MIVFARRFGSHFGYVYGKSKKKLWRFIIILLIFFLITYIIFTLRSHFLPLAVSMAEVKTKSIGTVIINEAVARQLSSNSISYSQLYDIQKNSSGEISAITANTDKMNIIKTQLTAEIQDKINAIDTQQIGIPIGSMLNNELLAGRGPIVPIKLVTLGSIRIDFKNSFVSAGINQTKHEVQLEVIAEITAMLSAGKTTAEVVSVIPVAQTIIVGDVPETYTNISL